VSGIEAFSSTCAHKRIHLTLRKLRDELLSSEHGEDFAVHLQSIRRHQFAAGDITMIGKCVDNWPKAGINFRRSRLLFPFRAGTRPPANQMLSRKANCMRRNVDGDSAAAMVAVLESELAALRIWQSARNPQRDLAVPDEIWDGMTISIDKIEAVLRKAGVKAKEEAKRGGI
jgi:hypothetical protein